MRLGWVLAVCGLGFGCAAIAGIEAADTTPSKQHCVNGVRDADEQDVDCGGKDCLACGGAPCTDSSQCQSNACDGKACVPPSCADGVFDGYESSVDCGDPRGALVNCALCSTGMHCFNHCNCASQFCDPSSHTCATGSAPACDHCADGVMDFGETGVDCGGPCAPCGSTMGDGGTDGGPDGGAGDGGADGGMGDGGADGGDGG